MNIEQYYFAKQAAECDLLNYIDDIKEIRCLLPWKRCWESGKFLFLRKAIRVECVLHGPGDDIRTYYYFEPKQWTIRLLKKPPRNLPKYGSWS